MISCHNVNLSKSQFLLELVNFMKSSPSPVVEILYSSKTSIGFKGRRVYTCLTAGGLHLAN